jgi:sensor histidine kinase YesM
MRENLSSTVYSMDSQYIGLFFAGSNGHIISFANSINDREQAFFLQQALGGIENWDIAIKPARFANTRNNAYTLFLFAPVSDPADFTRRIGTMGLSFSAMNIRQVYRRFDQYLKGSLHVIDTEGLVLYDSAAAPELPQDYPLADVTATRRGFFEKSGNIYNVLYSSDSRCYIVNVIPRAEVSRDVAVVRGTVAKVIAAVLIVAFLLTCAASYRIDRRLRALTGVMHEVRAGRLTGHAAPAAPKDELDIVHAEFLSVCDSLENYIQKEYIYRIKQKEMEFYVLQTQIDPHFLYNTLEAVRMKLLLTGEKEASRVIRILSALFRSALEEDSVVDIRNEINFLRDYLDVYKFRMGDKLEYEFDVEESVYPYACIRHTLQPIIENSLIHGLKDLCAGVGVLRLTVRKEGEDICFTVADNGGGIAREKLDEINAALDSPDVFHKSVGLFNVNSRLKIIFGDEYRLRIESRENMGVTVSLRVKALAKKELRAYVQGADS